MENRTVTLMIRHRDDKGGWRRSLAARGGNGRVKPGYAMLQGQPAPVKDGTYSLRMYVNRKLVYVPAGKNAAAADAQRARLEITSTAKVIAVGAGLEVVTPAESRTLKESAIAYIQDKKGQQFMEAVEQARVVSTEFIALMGKKKKTHIAEIVRQDIYDYHSDMRAKGLKDRTVSNKHVRLASWLTFAGIDKSILPMKPKYEESLPTIYESEQARALVEGSKPYLRRCMLLAWKCGLRDQELMHLETTDFNWAENTVRVQGKPKWKFKPKTWEQRDIPLTEDVVAEVKAWQKENPGKSLILGTRNNRPNSKLLPALKIRAKQIGLNCGECESCFERNKCKEFTLHRFRRTYITSLLRNGIDLRTVQAYAGHKDIKSTMRYLRPASGEEAQAKLNAVKW